MKSQRDVRRMLIKFIIPPNELDSILPITVTETSHTWSINRKDCEYLFDCNHEEFDTRIVLHASLLVEENVVVVAKDTDVLVLLVNEYSELLPTQEVMKYDTNKCISRIIKYLGPTVSNNIS